MVLMEYEGNQFKIIDFQNYFYKKSFGLEIVADNETTTTENTVVNNTTTAEEEKKDEEEKNEKPYSLKDDSRAKFLLGVATVGTIRNILNIQ